MVAMRRARIKFLSKVGGRLHSGFGARAIAITSQWLRLSHLRLPQGEGLSFSSGKASANRDPERAWSLWNHEQKVWWPGGPDDPWISSSLRPRTSVRNQIVSASRSGRASKGRARRPPVKCVTIMQMPVFSMISQTRSNWALSSFAMGRKRLWMSASSFLAHALQVPFLLMPLLGSCTSVVPMEATKAAGHASNKCAD